MSDARLLLVVEAPGVVLTLIVDCIRRDEVSESYPPRVTLILSFLPEDYAVLASDRRITWPNGVLAAETGREVLAYIVAGLRLPWRVRSGPWTSGAHTWGSRGPAAA